MIFPLAIIHNYGLKFFNLNALLTTDTELKDIAAAAIIGFSLGPPKAYSKPAAMGMPIVL